MNREDRPLRQPHGQRPITDSRQRPLFDVRQFRPHPYEPTSFFGVLERFGELLIRRDDFPTPADTGTAAWCHVLLSKLVLIQRHHGWTDRETVERATNDLRVKACLGLGVEQKGPSQPKLSVHRARMKELGLLDAYERRFVALVKLLGLLDDNEPLLIDSVPVRGAGQVL
ncbi:MAG: transposase, partial [Deltaproteobacteria bacterium]|nr:transposase [Deltaproteobacteria bacterium]